MDLSLFDWDEANINHIAAHDVSPEEAEAVILNDPFDLGFDLLNGEQRWSYLGETSEGRVFRVLITIRRDRIRVITAFEPSRRQRALYFEWKAGLQ